MLCIGQLTKTKKDRKFSDPPSQQLLRQKEKLSRKNNLNC